VAYRATFDVRFLHHELVRAGQRGIPASVPVVDPYVLFLEDAPRTLADALRFYCGEDHVEAHGSAGDVRAMAKVLRAQRERRGRSLAQLVVVPDKRWLDWDRKVYADATGIARFAFGKHRDHPVRDHWDYVEWMLSGEFSADTKTVLRAIMASARS